MLAIIMTGVILLSGTTVWAKEKTIDVEDRIKVINLAENITDDCIDEITDSINAGLMYQDGTIVPVDTVITIEDISDSKARGISNTNENSYKVTVEASVSENDNMPTSRKIVSDSGDKNGSVEASATLQMIWTDVLGPNNILDQVSGTLTVKKGTVTLGIVKYGEGYRSAIAWKSRDVGAASSFEFNPNETYLDPAACYEIEFQEDFFSLYLTVHSSIFQ